MKNETVLEDFKNGPLDAFRTLRDRRMNTDAMKDVNDTLNQVEVVGEPQAEPEPTV